MVRLVRVDDDFEKLLREFKIKTGINSSSTITKILAVRLRTNQTNITIMPSRFIRKKKVRITDNGKVMGFEL